MKKKNLIFVLGIVMLMVFYAGCSKDVDIPLTTTERGGLKTLGDVTDTDNLCPEYLHFIYTLVYCNRRGEDTVGIMSDTVIMPWYFIEILIYMVENDAIELKNKNVKNSYLAKLHVVKMMIEKSEWDPARNVIEKDILPYSEKWIKTGLSTAGFLLEATLVILDDPYAEISVEGSGDCEYKCSDRTQQWMDDNAICNGKWVQVPDEIYGCCWFCIEKISSGDYDLEPAP